MHSESGGPGSNSRRLTAQNNMNQGHSNQEIRSYCDAPGGMNSRRRSYAVLDQGPNLQSAWPPHPPYNHESLRVESVSTLPDEQKNRCLDYYRDSVTREGQKSTYLMEKRPRGRAIIINNVHFTSPFLQRRDGSDKDVVVLDRLFSQMGFVCVKYDDQPTEGMWEVLQAEAVKDFSQDDCLAVVILSHGHKGVLFGTDGEIVDGNVTNCVKIEEITRLFGQIKDLYGKPKLFFYQACQGDNLLVPENDFDLREERNPLQFLKTTKDTSDAGGGKPVDWVTDVLIALATPPDFVSWRRPDFGTWFIQAIAEVFAKNAYKDNILDLLTKVFHLMNQATSQEGNKQAGKFESTLLRNLYFFPELFQDKAPSGAAGKMNASSSSKDRHLSRPTITLLLTGIFFKKSFSNSLCTM